jgi:hypothetical protein
MARAPSASSAEIDAVIAPVFPDPSILRDVGAIPSGEAARNLLTALEYASPEGVEQIIKANAAIVRGIHAEFTPQFEAADTPEKVRAAVQAEMNAIADAFGSGAASPTTEPEEAQAAVSEGSDRPRSIDAAAHRGPMLLTKLCTRAATRPTRQS